MKKHLPITMALALAIVMAFALPLVSALARPLAAGIQAQQVRDQGVAPRTGSAVLAGTVVTDEQTPQPVRRAMVSATNTEGTVTRTTYTDEAGRFSLTGLVAGRFTLVANKSPWLRTAYGAKRHDLPGTPITLKDAAQMTDIVLRMTRGAVLSGRITDENGEPAFGVSVRVLQLRTQFGERSFVPATGGSNFESTDDRGMYRIFGLPPGEYAVSATPRVTTGEVKAMTESEIRAIMNALQQQQAAQQQAQQTGQVGGVRPTTPPPAQKPPPPDPNKMTVAYAAVYYPGTTLASSATTVTITAGEERSGVDFSLRLVRTTTVEGIVVLPAGLSPQNVQLTMMPSSTMAGVGAGAGVGMAGLEVMAMQRASVAADGKFTYTAVPPGTYTISARASRPTGGAPGAPPPPPQPPPPGVSGQVMTFTSTRAVSVGGEPNMMLPDMLMMGGDPNGAQFWAQTDVPVDGTPVGGVTLALQPGMTITGKVEFRSVMVRPGADFKRVSLTLSPAPTAGGQRISMGVPIAQVDETGRFTISGVTPGKYVIRGNAPVAAGSGPAPAWRIGSAMFKGKDVLDFPFEVLPNEDLTDALVTFTDATQEIAGSLLDASGRPAPDYTIVVFAADKAFWTLNSRRVRTARPGTEGKFTVTGLPPGDYRMAAVVDVSLAEINDPAFLAQIGNASFPITLGLGEKKTQDLKISGGL